MRIEFTGDCTVAEAAELKARLLGALAGGEAVEASFAGVARADMSFFELVRAAQADFARRGLPLRLLPDLPPHLCRAAAWTGLAELCPAR
ncbi:Sulfate transporter/antisigma-factor antagonist STAS [Desulfovibrio sp. X2]|uniref:STAS domain-containing protein n=1 Tax=Desulfovibrio sp. X2 TaxID=941449 RepID=UPI0003587355|nr:STAS domain-containing protein [Desulfovibrio sp. X2]EPR43966.1 Sulfate transporter/antisigma-factor antagonist STAS [Desulfovibrio sp. X2]